MEYYDTDPFEIVKKTSCRLHNHVFIWSGGESNEEIPKDAICDCGRWSWERLSHAYPNYWLSDTKPPTVAPDQ